MLLIDNEATASVLEMGAVVRVLERAFAMFPHVRPVSRRAAG